MDLSLHKSSRLLPAAEVFASRGCPLQSQRLQSGDAVWYPKFPLTALIACYLWKPLPPLQLCSLGKRDTEIIGSELHGPGLHSCATGELCGGQWYNTSIRWGRNERGLNAFARQTAAYAPIKSKPGSVGDGFLVLGQSKIKGLIWCVHHLYLHSLLFIMLWSKWGVLYWTESSASNSNVKKSHRTSH